MTEARTVDEAYSSAGNTSDLTVKAERSAYPYAGTAPRAIRKMDELDALGKTIMRLDRM